MPIKSVLFDLDGTLCDTLPLHIEAFQLVTAEFTGEAFSPASITAHFGKTEEGIMAGLIPQHMPAAYQRYCQVFADFQWRVPRPIPGVEELIQDLHQRGVKIGIVTGRGPHTTQITLRQYQLEPYIQVVETGSPHRVIKSTSLRLAVQKLGLTPGEAVYVGDTESDMQAASTAGTAFAGAAWASTATLQAPGDAGTVGIFRSIQDFHTWCNDHV